MLYKIVSKKQLSQNVFTIDVQCPLVAQARQPGQFVIVGVVDENSERIPLTIAGASPEKGTITLVFQRVGKSTAHMSDLNIGDSLGYVAGPLGKPTHIENYGTVVCVGGGIGNAPLLPIARAMKQAGNKVISILGSRTKDLMILEDEFKAISDELIVMSDDGSIGRKGLVTEPLDEICQNKKPDLAIAIGPTIMMKFCCETTRKHNVKTEVSLNTIMIDGTGMCGGCRVEVGGETKFVCVDGPEFDGHLVNFDQMIKRLNAYRLQEQKSHEEYKEHQCRIGRNQ